jgi:hypothetical protein
MSDHPCHQHRPGHHTDACLTGDCGFCGTPLDSVASGECRACLRIVCENCDGGYQSEHGPICQPCVPAAPTAAGNCQELHRLCVFEFALACGHLVTVATTGWYPVEVSYCDRLGGTILRGDYRPFASTIDYVDVLSERYEMRPAGTPPRNSEIIGRRPRTDDPSTGSFGVGASTGRYPTRVGAVVSLDGSTARAETT